MFNRSNKSKEFESLRNYISDPLSQFIQDQWQFILLVLYLNVQCHELSSLTWSHNTHLILSHIILLRLTGTSVTLWLEKKSPISRASVEVNKQEMVNVFSCAVSRQKSPLVKKERKKERNSNVSKVVNPKSGWCMQHFQNKFSSQICKKHQVCLLGWL